MTEGNGANPIDERDPVMIKDLVDGDQAGNANPIEERDPVMVEDPVDIMVHITPAPEETMNPVMIKDLVDGDHAMHGTKKIRRSTIEERDPVMVEDPVDTMVHITPVPEETMNFFTTPEQIIDTIAV